MTHDSVAKKVREAKAKYPARYCPESRCLWNVFQSGPCPKHQPIEYRLHRAPIEDLHREEAQHGGEP